eukprot:COSAG02_NODE_844_length_16583_cov_116.650267_7_plen_1394_part_00
MRGGGGALGALLAVALAVPAALAQQTCGEQCQLRAQQCELVCTQARAQQGRDTSEYEVSLDVKLMAPDEADKRGFGTGSSGVAVSGSVALVGAKDVLHGESLYSGGTGVVYIFDRQLDGSWVQQANPLVAANADEVDGFGNAVAVSGSVAIVGTLASRSLGGRYRSAAYVFEWLDGSWAQAARLVRPEGTASEANHLFGRSVAVSGSVAVVGDPHDSVTHYQTDRAGSAYVYERQPDGSWAQVAKLVAADGAHEDEFGASVAVSESVAVVGAPGNDNAGNAPASGAAYVFDRRLDGSWVQVAKLVAADTFDNAQFGNSVAVSGSVAVVGAWQDGDRGNFFVSHAVSPGAAYVFERQLDGSWVQAKLVAPDAATGRTYTHSLGFPVLIHGDQFGTSVAVSESGSVVVVGAPYHEHVDESDDKNTGAVYEFERQPDGSWALFAKLEPAEAEASVEEWNLKLGLSVAVSGDVAVIGTRCLNCVHDAVYLYVKECANFRDVPSVVDNSCTECTGREPHECLAASCAPGYVNYQQGGFCCNGHEIEESVVTGSCTQCTSSAADECTDATCATGFGAFSNGTCCRSHLSRYAGACKCPAGQVENQLQTACEACPAGDQPNPDRTLCEACPSGRARSTQETCVSCEFGTAVNPGRTACEICAAGKQPSASHDDCELCNGTRYSTAGQCQDCPHPNVVDDSHQTCLPCPAGKSPSSNYSSCVRCTRATYSQFGINCLPCDAASIVDAEHTSCTKCDPGTEPKQNNTRCEQCPPGTVRSTQERCSQCEAGKIQNSGQTACEACPAGSTPNHNNTGCERCPLGTVRSTQVQCSQCEAGKTPNSDRTACESCAVGEHSFDGIVCTCDVGWYQYRGDRVDHFTEPIVCQEAKFETPQQTPQPGCNRCGRCVECNNTVVVASGYIRIFGPDASISVHKCMSKQGCHGEPVVNTSIAGCKSCKEKTLPLSAGCRPLYTGHFCSTCIDGYEFQGGEGVLGAQDCQPCQDTSKQSGIVVIALLVVLVIAAICRDPIIRRLTPSPAQMAALRAILRSTWQPARILITYTQIVGELGKVLDFSAPAEFRELVTTLSGWLSGLDVLSSAKCLGVDSFHARWRLQVVVIPLVMLIVPIFIFVFRRVVGQSQGAAVATLTSQLFFVVFYCYPRVCNYAFSSFIARTVATDVSVLVSDDRQLLEDEDHLIYKMASLVVIVLFAFGVPVVTAVLLFKAHRRLQPVNVAVRARVSQAFEIGLDEAEAAVHDITVGSSYGFLTAAFKPAYFLGESLDMLRKLFLVGLILYFERGSVAQIMIAQCVALAFLGMQLRCFPYKIDYDNWMRAATELHICLVIAIALAFRTDLDSQLGATFGANRPNGLILFERDLERRKVAYDMLLVSTFIVCVPGMVSGC